MACMEMCCDIQGLDLWLLHSVASLWQVCGAVRDDNVSHKASLRVVSMERFENCRQHTGHVNVFIFCDQLHISLE